MVSGAELTLQLLLAEASITARCLVRHRTVGYTRSLEQIYLLRLL